MPWGAVAGAVIGVAGSAMSSSTQAGAAEQAAQDQENASLAQLGLSADIFNAQSQMQQPTREVGGLAQSREAYLLGLTPNLDISQDFESPQVSFNPSAVGTGQNPTSLYYTGSNGQPISSGGYSAYGPTSGGSFAMPATGGGYYYPNGTVAPNGSSFSLAGGGQAVPGSTATGMTGPMSTYAGAYGGQPTAMSANPYATGTGTAAGAGAIPNPNASMPAGSYGSLSNPLNNVSQYLDPSMAFTEQQGLNAIQNQQATTGMALSPAALQAALGYTSGLASTEWNTALQNAYQGASYQINSLNALSSGGQIATGGVSSAASGLGTAGASALAGYGNAGAAGAIGAGNAISSGINGATNSIGGYNAYSALNGTGLYGNSYGSGGVNLSSGNYSGGFTTTGSGSYNDGEGGSGGYVTSD